MELDSAYMLLTSMEPNFIWVQFAVATIIIVSNLEWTFISCEFVSFWFSQQIVHHQIRFFLIIGCIFLAACSELSLTLTWHHYEDVIYSLCIWAKSFCERYRSQCSSYKCVRIFWCWRNNIIGKEPNAHAATSNLCLEQHQ